MRDWAEMNFDGLVGPTHNYAGLSFGNKASSLNSGDVSNPQKAALQGLDKMDILCSLGIPQGIFPPHQRPHFSFLRQLGFSGTDQHILKNVAQNFPALLANIYSASPMWCANAATVTAAPDSSDGRTHFTPANLISLPHRSIETDFTAQILRHIFKDERFFSHHPPLPSLSHFGDEGAANHTRLCSDHGAEGLNLYTYGHDPFHKSHSVPQNFPARQSKAASQAIARQHGSCPERTLFIQQNPSAIDAGVFHNDVIAVGYKNILFYHEAAFLNTDALFDQISDLLPSFTAVCVPTSAVPIEDAVGSYLFNSQLIYSEEQHAFTLLCPQECAETPSVKAWLDHQISATSPIQQVRFLEVRESMKNGGGPACLRLRVCLNAEMRASLPEGILFTPERKRQLSNWIKTFYRDRLCPTDLADPQLLEETQTALDRLTQILHLGSFYPFQQI